MSQPSSTSRFLIALAGSFLAVGATWMVRHPSDATRLPSLRAPTSVRVDNIKKTRLDRTNEKFREGKAGANFELSLSGTPAQDGVHLTGTVIAPVDQVLRGHKFSWILPEGYRVTQGASSGDIPDLNPGQSQVLSVIVDRSGQTDRPIVLHVFQLVNSEALGQVAQYDASSSNQPNPVSHANGKPLDLNTTEIYQ